MKNFETLKVGKTYSDTKGYEIVIVSGFCHGDEPCILRMVMIGGMQMALHVKNLSSHAL